MINNAIAQNKGFTRTGTLQDRNFIENNPGKAVGQNLLGAFGMNPQQANFGQGFQAPEGGTGTGGPMPELPPIQGYNSGYPMPPQSNMNVYNATGQYMANMHYKGGR